MQSFTQPGGPPDKPAPDQNKIKRKVKHKPLDMVPFAEVERILAVIRERTGDKNSQISIGCGYDSSTINQWKNSGQAPLRGKMAILGFACELELHKELRASAPVMFDHDELMLIFTRFLHSVSTIHIDEDIRKRIIGKLAAALAE